jgi:Carboxypeptidase regulatory-like domain
VQFPQLDFSSLFVYGLSLAMAACIVPTTHAQVDRAGFNGTVTDTSGKTLSGVQITALQTATGLHRETLTSPAGTYDIPELPVGVYRVTYWSRDFGRRSLKASSRRWDTRAR